MEFKVLMVMLLSVALSVLLVINGASLTSHQEQTSHDLAQENWFGYAAMPRKLLLNQKVEGIKDKNLVHNEALSGESRKEAAAAASEQTMHEGSDLTPLFSMDYTSVRKRRPVHNKSLPTTTTFP
ncbi:unnamed protein product [Lactuca saligna]|uniref:Uncharacterized protein n=1 Tax=Lactuca saligna TaxID=75948 RepID=A0AA36E0U7_LACSI|nr:unnamed protein product [Lactuca saligna]